MTGLILFLLKSKHFKYFERKKNFFFQINNFGKTNTLYLLMTILMEFYFADASSARFQQPFVLAIHTVLYITHGYRPGTLTH